MALVFQVCHRLDKHNHWTILCEHFIAKLKIQFAIITTAMAAKLAQQFQFEKVLKSTVQIRGFGSKNMYQ
jgi:hypothetical protein